MFGCRHWANRDLSSGWPWRLLLFAECQTGTRQRLCRVPEKRHSAKPALPLFFAVSVLPSVALSKLFAECFFAICRVPWTLGKACDFSSEWSMRPLRAFFFVAWEIFRMPSPGGDWVSERISSLLTDTVSEIPGEASLGRGAGGVSTIFPGIPSSFRHSLNSLLEWRSFSILAPVIRKIFLNCWVWWSSACLKASIVVASRLLSALSAYALASTSCTCKFLIWFSASFALWMHFIKWLACLSYCLSRESK